MLNKEEFIDDEVEERVKELEFQLFIKERKSNLRKYEIFSLNRKIV